MASKMRELFERCCRLCAEEQDVTIMIFGEEAESMLLQTKLKKYLLIGVEEEDKLPKNVCVSCCSKLQTVCDFIDMATKAQEVLVQKCKKVDEIPEQQLFSTITSKTESAIDEQLRHNIMEVSVDPMIVLQNSDEEVSIAESCQSKIDKITNLPSADGEYVTIKLIKRGEYNSSESNENNEEKSKIFKPFPCTICKRSFCTDLALKNHSWTHFNDEGKTSEKLYQCNQCDESFDLKSNLFAHLKEHRNNGICQLCGRAFRTPANLDAHMLLHFSMRKAYNCKVCGRSYNTRSNLAVHSVTHSDERPYNCHLCKKSFKRSQELKFHINQHTGAKPYKCPFCDKRFASSGNCYSHRNRMHPDLTEKSKVKKRVRIVGAPASPATLTSIPVQGEKKVKDRPVAKILTKHIYRYQCNLCEHSFMRKDNYTYHMFQHTGEKPFQCSLCPEKFISRKGLLGHHDKEHHNDQRPPALLSRNKYLQ